MCAPISSEQRLDLVDVLSRPGAEADVVEPDAPLHESFPGMLGLAGLKAERGAPADEVAHVAAVEYAFEAEGGHQPRVERLGLVVPADGEDDVRHSVHFDHDFLTQVSEFCEFRRFSAAGPSPSGSSRCGSVAHDAQGTS